MLLLRDNSFGSIYALEVLFSRLVCEFLEVSNFDAVVIAEGDRVRCGECTLALHMPSKQTGATNYQKNVRGSTRESFVHCTSISLKNMVTWIRHENMPEGQR